MLISSPQRHALMWTALALAAFALLWLLGPVLTPFVLGAVLAYALHPAVERLAAWRVPRVLAVLLVEALALLLLVAVFLLMVPMLAKELPLLRDQMPALLARLHQQFSVWLAPWGWTGQIDLPALKTLVREHLSANMPESLGALLRSARMGGSVLFAVLGHVVLMPVVVFYLLLDWPAWVARGQALVPPRFRASTLGFFAEIDTVLGQYLRGQLMVMAALAVYYSLALSLLGLDLALPLGVFTGLAVFIPYLGFGLGLGLALIVALLQFGGLYGVLGVLAVYGVGQVLESFVLTPRWVGERIGMSPLTVIFALMAFGQLFGFLGVLVALPVGAVLVVGARRLGALYRGSAMYLQ